MAALHTSATIYLMQIFAAAFLAILFLQSSIDKIVDLRAVQMGAKQLLVLARVSVRDDIPAGDAERLLARLRDRLRREHPEVMDSYVELTPS